MIKRILAIDDSPLIHQMYKLVMMRYKCEILSAMNGKEALELLGREDGIQLILLDINMPVMNGLQFLEKASAEGIPSRTPVIIISTEGKEDDTIRGLRLGAKGYVKKPFNPTDLHDLIRKIIPDAEAA